jgi:hypothetical protein
MNFKNYSIHQKQKAPVSNSSESERSDYPQSESDCSDLNYATAQTKVSQASRPLPAFLFKDHANQMKMIRRMSSSVLFGMSTVMMTEKDLKKKKPLPPPSLLSRGYDGARRNS